MTVIPRQLSAAGRLASFGFLPDLRGWARSLLFSGRLPAFLVAVAAGILAFGFLFTNDYQITGVVVTGAELTDAREVAATAGVLGAPVFDVDASRAAWRIGQLPTVERVETEVRFPDEMRIRIVERVPVVVWQTGGEQMLVDERGNVIAAAQMSDLPVVSGENEVVPGERIPPELVAAVSAIQTAGGGFDSFSWNQARGLALVFDGRTIIFGEPVEIPAKLAVLEEIEREVVESWEVLDLSEPSRPALR